MAEFLTSPGAKFGSEREKKEIEITAEIEELLKEVSGTSPVLVLNERLGESRQYEVGLRNGWDISITIPTSLPTFIPGESPVRYVLTAINVEDDDIVTAYIQSNAAIVDPETLEDVPESELTEIREVLGM